MQLAYMIQYILSVEKKKNANKQPVYVKISLL